MRSTAAIAAALLHLVGGSAPSQVHLATGADPATSMSFSWATTTASSPSSNVRIWNDDLAFNQTFSGASGSAYTITSMTDVEYSSPFIHHVRATGLVSETTYTYQIIGSDGSDSSPIYQFKTAPEAGSMPRKNFGNGHAQGDGPLTFGVIGDLGQTSDSASTVAHLQMEEDVSLVIHAGDLSYADGSGHKWDEWGMTGAVQIPLAKTLEIHWKFIGNSLEVH